ncbi:hypothetical protein AZA_87593 [Nitrospirillum viridazoti Y2]|nr:hypothetical protein AZA_87593 [Nitrospirillum amazonense Y2]
MRICTSPAAVRTVAWSPCCSVTMPLTARARARPASLSGSWVTVTCPRTAGPAPVPAPAVWVMMDGVWTPLMAEGSTH